MRHLGAEPVGEAVAVRRADGTVVVERADRLIEVSVELLAGHEGMPSWLWDPVPQILQLDTAGEYRYRWTGYVTDHGMIFERIADA